MSSLIFSEKLQNQFKYFVFTILLSALRVNLIFKLSDSYPLIEYRTYPKYSDTVTHVHICP